MGLLANILGSISGDPSAQPLFNHDGQPGALAQFGSQVTNLAVPAAQRPQAQAQQMQNDQQRQILAKMVEMRQQGANPMQIISALASYSPDIAEKVATIQAQNPLANFGQTATPAQAAPIGNVNPQADASLPWSTAAHPPAPSTPAATTYAPESPDDKRNYQFLSSLPPAVQGIVKGLSDGDENSGAQALKSPMALQLQALAKQFDPSFSQTAFTARNATAKGFSPDGNEGKTITAANTGTKHLAQLAVAAHDMHNSTSSVINWFAKPLGQYILPQGMGGNPSASNFDADVTAVAPELDKVNSGSGTSSVAGTKEQIDSFSKYGSPASQFGAIAEKANLLQSKADELGETYKKNMGGRTKEIISPENQQNLKDIRRLADIANSGDINGKEATDIVARLRKVVNPDAGAPSQTSTSAKPALDPATALAIAKQRGLIK